MAKDLTSSPLERQNILNNRYALEKIEEHLGLVGTYYDGEILFTKQQLVQIFNISDSTIEKYLASHSDELRANGYTVLRGQKLRKFKALLDVSVTDYGNKTPALGVFTFRATLNLAMVLIESDLARAMRSRILDIVIDAIAERTGGHTKYINGYQFLIKKFVLEMENIAVWVAEGKISKELLCELVKSLIFEEDFSEELKLQLACAVISTNELKTTDA